MLRQLNRSSARGRICGTSHAGVLGSLIPSTGDNGPSYLYNDITLPSEAHDEFSGQITTWPTLGTLFAYEDGSFTYSGQSDTFQYQLRKNGVIVGVPTPVTLTMTAGATINAAVGNATASGAQASIYQGRTIAAAVGNAAASGSTATISTGGTTTIACSAGDATAGGAAATITRIATINATVGNAAAAGLAATINVVTWSDSPEGYSVPAELNGYSVEEGHMSIETFQKQPAEVLDIDVSFVEWLERRNDSIASAADVEVTGETGITLPQHQLNAGVVKVWHASGTDRERYKVTITATTVGGRVKQVEHYMRVKET